MVFSERGIFVNCLDVVWRLFLLLENLVLFFCCFKYFFVKEYNVYTYSCFYLEWTSFFDETNFCFRCFFFWNQQLKCLSTFDKLNMFFDARCAYVTPYGRVRKYRSWSGAKLDKTVLLDTKLGPEVRPVRYKHAMQMQHRFAECRLRSSIHQ